MAPRPQTFDALFDAHSRERARHHHAASGFRALVLGERPGDLALRAVLSAAWSTSGDSRAALRRGLEHERWGQHVGALAHLLTLAALQHLGGRVRCEPRLGGRTPDLHWTAPDGSPLLVEVRAFSGGGQRPWEGAPSPDRPSGAGRPAVPALRPGRPLDERQRRQRARRLAAQKAEAAAANARDLERSLDAALRHKAGRYRELCATVDEPLLIVLYQDTDTHLDELVLAWSGGVGTEPSLSHLAGVLVLGRHETPRDDGAVQLTASLIACHGTLDGARAALRRAGVDAPLTRDRPEPGRLSLPVPR